MMIKVGKPRRVERECKGLAKRKAGETATATEGGIRRIYTALRPQVCCEAKANMVGRTVIVVMCAMAMIYGYPMAMGKIGTEGTGGGGTSAKDDVEVGMAGGIAAVALRETVEPRDAVSVNDFVVYSVNTDGLQDMGKTCC